MLRARAHEHAVNIQDSLVISFDKQTYISSTLNLSVIHVHV